MKRSVQWLGLALVSCSAALVIPCPATRPRMHGRRRSIVEMRGGANQALSDHSSAASSLFGNYRVPAALFAGAAAGAAFGLPISESDLTRTGVVKRVYALLMLGSLSAELVTVIVATLAMGLIAARRHAPTENVGSFLREHYHLEYVAVRFNFLVGLLGFTLAMGLRAWVSISCPVIAKAALGIVLSSTMLALSFIEDASEELADGGGLLELPYTLLKLLAVRAKRKPMFGVAVVCYFANGLYIALKTPQVLQYLSAAN